jgi:hypothetical protein
VRGWTLINALKSRPFDDGAGLPAAEPSLLGLGRWLTVAATMLLALTGLWEIGAPFGAGHYAAATGVLTSGENFWRYWTLAPLPQHPVGDPSNAEFYCHHPFGIFWTAGFFALLGHHDWVCRLPAVLMSSAMPALLYAAGRALYGPLAGGLGALAFAVLPITLAYANFFALEVPTLFGLALSIWGFVRFAQAGRRRFALIFVLGLGYAMAADWPGFVFAGLVLGWLFLRGFVLRGRFAPLHFERFATAWAAAAVLAVLLFTFHVAVFAKLDRLDDFIRQGEFRSKGHDLPLADALAQRSYWIALAFTPLAVLLGKVAVAVLAMRAFFEKHELEIFPLAVLGTATFQYVVFKQGADIHFFWPHYFALYFAYAFGALAATLERVVRWAFVRFGRTPAPRRLALVVLGCGALPLLAILPDGLRALKYARKSGGRFNEKGHLIHADFDKAAALAAVARKLPEEATLGVHASMKQSYWMDWVSERPLAAVAAPALNKVLRTSHFCLDMRFTPGETLRELARDFALEAYGPFLFSDLRAPAEPLAGFAVTGREPGILERFWVSSNHELYDVTGSALWTWELREHLDQEPNPVPGEAAKTPEALRIAHNLALAGGDTAHAARLLSRLLAGANRGVARAYAGGVELLAARYETGASDLLTLYFRAGTPLERDQTFVIVSHVEAPPALSLTPRDKLAWDVGMPFAIPTSLWRPGFVYTTVTEIIRRPGRERYTGAWRGAGALTDEREVPLLTLE